MNTTKYQIELPTLPDGFEVVGPGFAQSGDLHFSPFCMQWLSVKRGNQHTILARRKRTLVDWANEQPLFKALAEMRRNCTNDVVASGGTLGPWWNVAVCSGGSSIILNLGVPPCDGRITLENGKWKDVP